MLKRRFFPPAAVHLGTCLCLIRSSAGMMFSKSLKTRLPPRAGTKRPCSRLYPPSSTRLVIQPGRIIETFAFFVPDAAVIRNLFWIYSIVRGGLRTLCTLRVAGLAGVWAVM